MEHLSVTGCCALRGSGNSKFRFGRDYYLSFLKHDFFFSIFVLGEEGGGVVLYLDLFVDHCLLCGNWNNTASAACNEIV